MQMSDESKITSKSLQHDASNNLDDYYQKRQELIDQIDTFEEALESARDALKALDKDNRTKLKKAGVKKVTQCQILYDTVKVNPGLTFTQLVNMYSASQYCKVKMANSIVCNAISKEHLINKEGMYYTGINPKDYKKQKGATDSILNLLKDGLYKSAKDIYIKLESLGFTKNSLSSCLCSLVKRGIIQSTSTHKNDKKAKYYIPTIGTTNESDKPS